MKHTKFVLKTFTNKNLSMSKKIKEVILEIFIIVFAVTLSISLHSWTQTRNQQQEANEFLNDLKKDLAIDIVNLQNSKDLADSGKEEYEFLLNLTPNKIDTLSVNIQTSYITLKFISLRGNFEGFKSSGKLGYIKNKKLKGKILNFYEQTIPDINDSEILFQTKHDYFYDNVVMSDNIDIKDDFLKYSTKYRLRMLIAITESLSEKYKAALIQTKEIIREIDNDLK